MSAKSHKGSDELHQAKGVSLEDLDGVAVQIGSDTVYVHEFTIPQWTALARIVAPALSGLNASQQAAVEAAAKAGSGSTTSNISMLLGLFTDDVIAAIFGVVIDRPSEWCLVHLRTSSLGRIAKAAWDANEADMIRGLFTKAAVPSSSPTSQGLSVVPPPD